MSTPRYPPVYQCRLKLTAYDDLDAVVSFVDIGDRDKLVIVSVNLEGDLLLALKESEFAVNVSLSNIEYRTKLAYGAGDYYKLSYNNHEVGFDENGVNSPRGVK